jgi:hypothetical protein
MKVGDAEHGGTVSWKRLACVAGALLFAACTGDDGKDGLDAQRPTTPDELGRSEDSPGVELAVLGLSGGTGPGGNFRVGDRISVTFRVTKDDGTDWRASELDLGRILVSGPTINYQRVLAERSDLVTAARANADGSLTYTFADPIPASYLAPLNDTSSFGALDGELAGQALLSGTYTVGLYVGWNYTVEGESFRDPDNATLDFLLGDAQVLAPREVVKLDNCNQCHSTLQAHGGTRRDVRLCVLCHTAGAEDRNVADAAGGTPGASIAFEVMIHKLHAGAHLPSVLGIGTNPDGSRDYAATPQPYQLVGFQDRVSDFSAVGFPVMPSAYTSYLFDTTGTTYKGTGGNGPMPRDVGYGALPLAHKLLEDEQRAGVVACTKCHGDPDGGGPLTAPAQGDLYRSQPSRLACGSCHDDVAWGNPYTSNGSTMPAQANDSNCTLCHAPSGNSLAIQDAHTHPYSNPDLNTGANLTITGIGGGSGPGGRHQAGDPFAVTFSVTDDAGQDLQVHGLTRFQMFVSGPTENPQWMVPNVNAFDFALRKSSPFSGNGTIGTPVVGAGAEHETIAVVFTSSIAFDVLGSVSPPLAGQSIGAASGATASVSFAGVSFTITQGSTAFAAGDRWYFEVVPTAASYTLNVPRDVSLELLGTASGGAETLAVANAPLYWGRQTIFERSPLAGPSTPVLEDCDALDRYVAADSALLPGLAVGDRVVVDDGTAQEEYLTVGRIQTTDDRTGLELGVNDHIWFTTAMRYAHATGASIQEVTLNAKREGLAYSLATSAATSVDLLDGQFTPGNRVVASYRTHGRFGFTNAPGEALQMVYLPAAADSDDIDVSGGDWSGLPLVDGTYTAGMWANKDFTVTPLGAHTTTGPWDKLDTDNTTYRMISPPATQAFLFGNAASIVENRIIASGESCNACHGDIQAHGFGRRGLETCLLCHRTSGAEDGAPYSFAGWYVPPTPGVTTDFRTLLHKVHMGEELAHASSFVVDGVFLGTPYPVTYDEVAFPSLPGGAMNCEKCHGEGSTSWHEPASRAHPDPRTPPTRDWRAVCGACHDSDAAAAHIDVQTSTHGAESCAVCHGPGKEWNVALVHKTR